ncbi:MAG: hypothetical protein AAFY65_16950 [Pseudomonadota bacterium]
MGAAPAVLKLSDHGLQSTAQTIVAHDDMIAADPAAVSAILDATFEGWRRVLADKPAAAQLVVDSYVPDGSPYEDVAYQTKTLELLAPYVAPTPDAQIGQIDPARWQAAAQLMADYGIVEALPDLDTSLAPGLLTT